jgi:N-sulfoglucosamine sulfohydrolase
MYRTLLHSCYLLGGALCLFCLMGFYASAEERPNFVVFIADDMGWDDCGAYGHPHIRTPNMDRLAAEGLRFDRAYLTCSSCSPSRCSILTGRYPHATGASELHLPLPAEQVLLTQPLREAGYWTAAIGKWHLGNAVVDQVDLRVDSTPEKMGQAWLKAIRERPRDQPFMLWAAHSDPHRPYPGGAAEPPHTRQQVRVPQFLPDTPEVRADLALYYDEITRFDEHVGLVLAELQNQGVLDHTLVLVMTDNGRPFPHCKTRVHVPGVRTPFLARWPEKIAAGGVTESLVSALDIAPTILQLAGLNPPASFQGVSFAKILSDPKASVREYAFAEHNWHDYRAFERAVHTPQLCYIRNWLPDIPGTPPADAVKSPTFLAMQSLEARGQLTAAQRECFVAPRPGEFLFDVVADPECVHNLAADPQRASELSRLRQALEQWQTETGDHFPGESQLTPDGFDRQSGERIIKAAHPALQRDR